ncbi:MAG: hypothetical protein KGO82_12705 [Bacteroidota bacterium]|nr:hypothetical protein [Bacteroidota bacterium]
MSQVISSVEGLRSRIASLEHLRLQQEAELRHCAKAAIDSIRPSQLLKNAVSHTLHTPGIGTTVLKGAAGLAAGVLARRMLVKTSAGVARKAAGTLLQVGLAKAVAGNASKIVNAGTRLFQKWFKKQS